MTHVKKFTKTNIDFVKSTIEEKLEKISEELYKELGISVELIGGITYTPESFTIKLAGKTSKPSVPFHVLEILS